jgi:hypothetical protein
MYKLGVPGFRMVMVDPPPRPPPVYVQVRSTPIPLQFVIDKKKLEYSLWKNTIVLFVTWTVVFVCLMVIMSADE